MAQARAKEFNTGPAAFLIIYHILLLIALPFYFYYYPPSWSLIAISIVLLYVTGMSITAGYHRLYSHRAYKVSPVVEGIILFFSSMSVQSSALRWAFDHRLHHAHVDTDNDPYSINKGFWYAHFLWMMEKPRPIDPKVVPDLLRNPLVKFQEKHNALLMLLTNLLVFFGVGWLLDDYVGAFFCAGWLRIFALHHFTWFINSLAHTWGEKPFCQEQTAVDNYFLSMLTFGEGYHNYHHTFANDYRNGIRWYHFDPTKWLIWTLNKFGLAYDLKRMSPLAIKKKMVMERKSLLIEKLKTCWDMADEMEKQVNEISERIVEKISSFTQLKERYKNLKEARSYEKLDELKQEIRQLQKSLRQDWKVWGQLSKQILNRKQELQAS